MQKNKYEKNRTQNPEFMQGFEFYFKCFANRLNTNYNLPNFWKADWI